MLQGKLNTEIADRAAGLANLRSELINPVQVATPIVQINNNEIVANAVTTDKILDRTIVAADLGVDSVVGHAPGAVNTNVKAGSLRGQKVDNGAGGTDALGDLATGTITGNAPPTATAATGNLALGTVTGEGDNNIVRPAPVGNLAFTTVGRRNLVADAVDTTKIALDTILANDIATGAVTTDEILNGTILNEDLAGNSVTTDKIAADTILANDIATGAVTTDEILNGTILNADLADNSVTSSKIVDGTVVTADLANNSVTTGKIVDDAVTNDKLDSTLGSEAVNTNVIRDNAVTTAKIADFQVIGTALADLTPGNVITVGKLAARTVGTKNITSGAVTTNELAADAVTTARILDGTILVGDLNDASIDGTYAKDAELAAEALARSSADTALQTNIDAEAATRAAADTALQAFDTGLATQVNGGVPNSATPGDTLVDWSRLNGVPTGFADNTDNVDGGAAGDVVCAVTCVSDAEIDGVAGSKVTGTVANATTAATANDLVCAGTCVSSDEIAGLDAVKLTGTIDVARIGGGSITGDKLANFTAGAVSTGVTADKLEEEAVTMSKLGADVITRFEDVEKSITDLSTVAGTPGTGAETVDYTRITGRPGIDVITATPLADTPVPANSRLALVFTVAGAELGDSVIVAPPGLLAGNLILGGARISAADTVTVFIYNPDGAAVNVLATDVFQFTVIDSTP